MKAANPAWAWPARVLAVVVLTVPLLAAAAQASDLNAGWKAFAAGRLDEAMDLFDQAFRKGRAEGQAGIGMVHLARRHYDDAAKAFELAQRMDGSLAAPVFGLGEIKRRQGDCAAALPLLLRATEMDRRYPEAELSLGDCRTKTGKFAEAIEGLSRGLKWGEQWRPKFLVALGDVEFARDSLRDAGIYYTRARQEAPLDPVPARALGDFYLKRGTYVLAVPEFIAAVNLDTSNVDLHFGLGKAYFYTERYTDALKEYKIVVDRDPEFAEAQLALGDLLFRAGAADARRFADAREPLEKYTQMRPEDPAGWSLLGRTLAELRVREEALEALNKAEQLGDKSKDMHNARARLNIGLRNWEAALADFERGAPEADDQLRIAQVLVFLKQPARAESVYTTVVEADPKSASARFALQQLGLISFRAKDYAEAARRFERHIELDPASGEAYYFAGLSYKELQDFPAALEALRKSAALDSSTAERQFWLGILYAQLDSTSSARHAFERAVELDTAGTDKNTGVALRQLGFYELLDQKYPAAIQVLERAVTINGNDVQAWVWLAQGWQNSGNRSKACEAYQRALALDPKQPDAIRGRQTLGC